jgi:hypothetical protein
MREKCTEKGRGLKPRKPNEEQGDIKQESGLAAAPSEKMK